MPDPFRAGEWPCYRANKAQDGRVRGRGTITAPSIAWQHFVGSIESALLLEPGAGEHTLTLPIELTEGLSSTATQPRWGFVPPLGPIEGRMQPIAHTFRRTFAPVLEGEEGLQRIEFESGFSLPTVNGQWSPGRGCCWAWRKGEWVKVWETEPVQKLFQPFPVAGDHDGDGAPEVVVLPMHYLIVFDARTGREKDRVWFTGGQGRSYGFFGVYDLDGDGKNEFLVMADFAKHIDVLGYREGKVQLLWQHEVEMDIANPFKIMRVHPQPVADVDGDGHPEILVSLYNDTGDERWHILAYRAMTGEVVADLPDEYLYGLCDVDGDGTAELLTLHANGSGLPTYGQIAVRSLRGGTLSTRWECPDAAWQTWEPPLPQNVRSTAVFGRRDVLHRLVQGHMRLAYRRPALQGGVELTLATWQGEGLLPLARVTGPGLEAIALDEAGCALLRAVTAPGESATLSVHGGRVRALNSCRAGNDPSSPVVAWPQGEQRPTILVQGSSEDLVALRAPQAGEPARELWRRPARGQGIDWPRRTAPVTSDPPGDLSWPLTELKGTTVLGVVLADLAGDGTRQMLYATSAPSGCARLVAARLEGGELWHHDFPRIPGTPPYASNGGLILWQAGHFAAGHTQDVLVTTRRSAMHSEESWLLSGGDGHEVWHRNRQPLQNRAVGGEPFAVADFDGDGLDEAASLHPSVYYILKGTTGQDWLAMEAKWKGVPAQPVYWGVPSAGDFEGNGRAAVFFGTHRAAMTGVIRADGSLAWYDALDISPKQVPAIGDFDGDGRLEAIGWGYTEGAGTPSIRWYDTATGQIKWRLAVPVEGVPQAPASGDLDGDGRDEALFVLDKTLFCLGAGEVSWQLELPVSCGAPTIADVEGEGRLSILLMGEDGYLYGVR